jgi:cupin fold WbuC family metalloprotein
MREINEEVLMVDEPVVRLTREDVARLKAQVARNARRRIRICAHKSAEDAVHEMVIALARGCYIRPHKQANKSKSFHVVEGAADLVLFDDEGNVTEVLPLGEYASGRPFFYRTDRLCFHTLFIRSDAVVLHETIRGPFRPSDAVLAPWSPDEHDSAGVASFLGRLEAVTASARAAQTR